MSSTLQTAADQLGRSTPFFPIIWRTHCTGKRDDRRTTTTLLNWGLGALSTSRRGTVLAPPGPAGAGRGGTMNLAICSASCPWTTVQQGRGRPRRLQTKGINTAVSGGELSDNRLSGSLTGWRSEPVTSFAHQSLYTVLLLRVSRHRIDRTRVKYYTA